MENNNLRNICRTVLVVILVVGMLVAGLSWFVSSSYAAEKFPVRAITVIVPFTAGGQTDLNARFVVQSLSKYLGQPVVVENRPGAGGVQGTLFVAKARPDGYTLLFNSPDSIVYPHYVVPGATNPKDLEPVAIILGYPRLLVVSAISGLKSVEDLKAFAKKDPKKLLVSINPGSGSGLDTISVMKAMKIEPTYVPFKGSSERVMALAGGHVHAGVDGMTSLRAYIEAKKVIPLGVGLPKRMDPYKDFPTLKELGVDVTSFVWEGAWAPKGTPADVLQILESAFEKASKDQELIKQLAKNYMITDFLNRKELSELVTKEGVRIKRLLDEMGPIKK